MKRASFIIMMLLLFSIITSCNNLSVPEKSIRYADNKVVYETRGDAQKTLFFIHGWTGSRDAWKHQLNAFDEFRVIAIDLPGNGKSSKNTNVHYTMDLFADTINKILEKENVKSAVFIGHSMGFAIAEVMAMKYPQKCDAIISIDGAHFEIPQDSAEADAWIQYNRMFAKSMEKEQGREDFINALFLPETPQLLKDEVIKVSREVPLTIAKSMIEGVEAAKNYWKKRIMPIPCLAIYSPAYQLTEKDKFDFKRTYPQVKYYEVENVSHFLMLEMPYKVNQMILDYLYEEDL